MNQVYIETIAMYVIWTVAMLLLRGKAKRIVAIVGAALAVGLIIMFTVLNRSSDGTREISLIPFISFQNAKVQPEFYRTMYMNVLLFMPLGLSLPFALEQKIKHNILWTIVFGAGLSITVEVLQYVFCLGRCEIDDVLMNTFGVIIGLTSYLLISIIKKLR